MKWYFALLFSCLLSLAYGQSVLPIEIKSDGYMAITVTKDSVVIDGIYPITMDCINYKVHQYDESTKIHYWGFGYALSEGCSRMDQEFGLWISPTASYWVYTDYCVGLILFRGPSDMASYFRSTIQLPFSYDFDTSK